MGLLQVTRPHRQGGTSVGPGERDGESRVPGTVGGTRVAEVHASEGVGITVGLSPEEVLSVLLGGDVVRDPKPAKVDGTLQET